MAENTALSKALDSAASSVLGDGGGTEPVATTAKTDTAVDTSKSTASHTSDAGTSTAPTGPSKEAVLGWLKENAKTLPSDELSFLDSKFQPDYTRRLNTLNEQKATLDKAVKNFSDNTGLKIPEGASAYDFLTSDDGGKNLKELLSSAANEAVKPVRDAMFEQQRNQLVSQTIGLVVQNVPVVKENLSEALNLIDSDPVLQKLALEGNVLPQLLEGAASVVAMQKQAKRIEELEKKLEAVKVGAKTGKSSTSVTGERPSTSSSGDGPAKSLKDALQRAAARMDVDSADM